MFCFLLDGLDAVLSFCEFLDGSNWEQIDGIFAIGSEIRDDSIDIERFQVLVELVIAFAS